MVPLEALGCVRGRQGQRRVGAAQRGQARPGIGDRLTQGRRRVAAPTAQPTSAAIELDRGPGRLGSAPGGAGRGDARSSAGDVRDLGRPVDGERREPGRKSAGAGCSVSARPTRSSTRGSSSGQGDPVGTERHVGSQAGCHGRQELPPGAGQDRPARSVGRPAPEERVHRGRAGGRGGQDEPPRRAGTGADLLREALPVVLHEADRAGEDGRRAAVVDGEVDAPEARQRVREARGHVARRPASSRRCSGRRRRRGRCGSPGRPGAAPGEAGSRRRPGPRRRGGGRTASASGREGPRRPPGPGAPRRRGRRSRSRRASASARS